jgi:hypothetical protein
MSLGQRTRVAASCAALLLASTTLPGRAAASFATPAPSGDTHSVTLVTGERVLVTHDAAGRLRYEATGSNVPLFTYATRSDTIIADAAARPFVGARLDRALFDTADLDSESTAGRVPVLVTWHGSSAPSMPWLLRQRSAGPGLTSGVISAASGALLRSDLAAQPRSPSAAWSGPLAGVDHIGFAGPTPTPPPPGPQFVEYTLTVNGINAAGRPSTGDVLTILNTDNAQKFVDFAIWNRGVIKLALPAGHYSLFAQFVRFRSTGAGSLHMLATDIVVRGSTTVTMDARTATSLVSVQTPFAYGTGSATVDWQRIDAPGTDVVVDSTSWFLGAGTPPFRTYMAPASVPRVGSQGWIVSFHLDSPDTSTSPYSFDLNFGSVGSTPASERYSVAATELAAVDTAYASDVVGRLTGELRFGFLPWQIASGGIGDIFAAPMERTEYVQAAADLVWQQNVIDDVFDFAGFFFDSNRNFQAGTAYAEPWNRGPIGPGLMVNTGAAGFQFCPACFEANTLELNLYPFGDNPPGHAGLPNFSGPGISESDAATLQRDGVTIAQGSDPAGAVPVPAGPARYRLTYDVSMSSPAFWTLSTTSHTIWTFRTPQSLSSPLPASWTCFSGTSIGCSVVALMIADYELPVNLTNQAPAGPINFDLAITHVLDVALPVTQLRVAVSFDHGASWHAAQIGAEGGDLFRISYTNPSGAATASLHVVATDAAGGALDQTIIDAYGIS